jgi:hypothetical protein
MSVPSSGDLQRLLDDRAIRDVLLRYCRGIDRIDLGLVRDCYHADALDDHGAFQGGVEEFVTWIGRLLPRYGVTMHQLMNTLVEFHPTDPDVARVETYGVAEHQTPGGPPELNLTIAFRYLDRFERRDRDWRVADRYCTTEWVRVNDPALAYPVDERYPHGKRDGTDRVFDAWEGAQPSGG